MTAGVYRIRNRLDGRAYIGSAVSIEARLLGHQQGLTAGTHHNRALLAAWRRDGRAAFSVGVLEVIRHPSEAALGEAERRWVARYPFAALYNAIPVHRRAPIERAPRIGGTMIRIHLSRELGERRMSLVELHRRTGISRNGLHALASGRATRLDFASLDKICTALGCAVADILEHVPD